MRPPAWTKAEDRALLDGVKAGRSLREMGAELRGSENAAIARYNRLRGVIFHSDAKRGSTGRVRLRKDGTPVRRVDDEALRRLWPTRLPDKELAARLGHDRGTLRRRAAALGLPTSRRAIWGRAS
jgi:hypothetical protein